MNFSVIIPTHNPDRSRLVATLEGLAAQTTPTERWELIIVDNASTRPPRNELIPPPLRALSRIVAEPRLGLSSARRTGFGQARGEIAVLVDDDNVLDRDYLANAERRLEAWPRAGVLGGRSLPCFEAEPPSWTQEFFPLLALRDLGPEPRLSAGLRPAGSERNAYPSFAPLGAGMVVRRAAWEAWIEGSRAAALSDRRGTELTSAGDNDIVLAAMTAGWEAGYAPELTLKHLIPATRLQPEYLARLNRGIQRSWMQVLSAYDANPWPPLSAGGATVRKAKAWLARRAWSGPAARVRWAGACGHFEGRTARR